METDNIQQNQSSLPEADLRAALGYATNLMSQMLPQDEPQAPVEPKTAPTANEKPEHEEMVMENMEALKTEVMTEVKNEIKKEIETQIGEIRKDLKEALKDDTEN